MTVDEDREARERAMRIITTSRPGYRRTPQHWGPDRAKEDLEFYMARCRVIAKQRQDAEAEAKARRKAEDERELAELHAEIDARRNEHHPQHQHGTSHE